MKILITSDIHGNQSAADFIATYLGNNNPDVFAISGDVSNGDISELESILSKFGEFQTKKLFVCGNHDLWTFTDEDSMQKYTVDIPEICQRYGFHYLDKGPFVQDNVGFVGNIGWSDASFRVKEGKIPNEGLYTPDGKHFKRWEELTMDDYRDQRFHIAINREKHPWIWNDTRFINMAYNHKQFLDMCLHKMQSDIDEISSSVNQIIFVSHHLPFEDMVKRNLADVGYSIGNAYMGSEKIGDLIKRNKKIRTVISGHSHYPGIFQIGKIRAYNTSDELAPRICLLEI